MDRRTWIGVLAGASLLLTGCAASASGAPGSPSSESSHVMPDGTVMPGSEHEGHGDAHATVDGPSEAAQMVCAGQVVTSVTQILALDSEPVPSSTWDEPMYSCTYEVDGAPLVLSVHDATDESEGQQHFDDLQSSTEDAETIEGLLGLGMPSFSTGDGIVAFLRDGKTLVVDATALPAGLGPNAAKTQHDAAYAVASAVLVCWVDHS